MYINISVESMGERLEQRLHSPTQPSATSHLRTEQSHFLSCGSHISHDHCSVLGHVHCVWSTVCVWCDCVLFDFDCSDILIIPFLSPVTVDIV